MEKLLVESRGNEAWQNFKQTKDGKDYLACVKARNQAKTEVRKAVRDYEREAAKQAKRNPKAFYKFVNSTRHRKAPLYLRT